jgi:glyceraldehyde 3-phosphate dehydrogenase
MTVRVGINGFGRIGRSFTRALLARGDDCGVELVAVNEPMGDSYTVAFLLKHDSVGGTLPNDIQGTDAGLSIDGREIRKLEVMDPAEIPWSDHAVDVVIESTGLFTAREKAAGHLGGSVQRVIISAPSGDADATICMGVNDGVYDPSAHTVISNASCTTNCLAPLAKVLNDRFGIEQGLMTTVHAYTSDQSLVDLAKATRSGKPDLRRMRAAALSIIPNTTGAARAIGLVLPELKGRLDGTALRVPTPTGSITDLSANLATEAGIDEVNEAFEKAAADPSYRGVLEYSEEDLVSADIVHNPASCIFSSVDTMANGRMVKVLGWYDNEWGYSNRLVDLVAFVGEP